MNNVNKTLYIPLYGKNVVSKKGIILKDEKAEEIWEKEGFELKGKAKSKWLAYYMGMRSAVFDKWVGEKLKLDSGAVVIQIGCGLDSRILRIGNKVNMWYDVDFDSVMQERYKYYGESENYHMICADARELNWINQLPVVKNAIIVMEGVCMYMNKQELIDLFETFERRFEHIYLLADFYTEMAAKMSKYKNPINEVGVTVLYGIDDVNVLKTGELKFDKEHDLTPDGMIDELKGFEKRFFRLMFAGKFAKNLYRLYEFGK